MKYTRSLIKVFVVGLLLSTTACEDYLERTPDAAVTETDLFGNFKSFQGYVEQGYSYLVPYAGKGPTSSIDCGDDVSGNKDYQSSYALGVGNYGYTWNNQLHNLWRSNGAAPGIWEGGLAGIRHVNIGLEKLDIMASNEPKERDYIKGQLLFLRAWFHFEIARSWGGIPYMDKAYSPNDNLKLPRLSIEETFLRIAADFTEAAALLPTTWIDEFSYIPDDKSWGRFDKYMALAMKARTYMYLASPWVKALDTKMPENSEYNLTYCNMAAEAAYEVISSGQYELLPWDQRHLSFYNIVPTTSPFIWTKDIIFSRISAPQGKTNVDNLIGRIHLSQRTVTGTSANGVVVSPTLAHVNKYETVNGLSIEDDPTYDASNPWKNRDPRMRKNILLDGTLWVKTSTGVTTAERYIQTYSSGGSPTTQGRDMEPSSGGSSTGFLVRKYVGYGVNGWDKEWNSYKVNVPYVRFAEMYLIYAEMMNEIGGPNATLDGVGLTAVEAVNTIRRTVKLPVAEDITKPWETEVYGTASLPDVPAIYTGSKEAFRERIRNERAVELAFEGHRWFDTRRWFIAHKLGNKLEGLKFDKNHTSYQPFEVRPRVFENPKHYLLPFKRDDVYLYEAFKQNPGWE